MLLEFRAEAKTGYKLMIDQSSRMGSNAMCSNTK